MADLTADARKHIVVSVAGTRLAVDTEAVLAGAGEEPPQADLAMVPLAPTIVAGLTNHNGTVVAVIDLRTALGTLDERDPQEATATVFVRTDRGPIGLQVDTVDEHELEIASGELHPIPLTMVPAARSVLRGIHQAGRDLVAVLDVNAVMDLALGGPAVANQPPA